MGEWKAQGRDNAWSTEIEYLWKRPPQAYPTV